MRGTLLDWEIAPVDEEKTIMVGVLSDWSEGEATLSGRGVLVGVGVYAA